MNSETSMFFWYLAGFTVLLALCHALGYYGSKKGYSFALCFLLGILTSPLVALIIVYLLPERHGREGDGRLPPKIRLAMELEKARMAAAR